MPTTPRQPEFRDGLNELLQLSRPKSGARSCVRKRCGGAVIAASSRTICWRPALSVEHIMGVGEGRPGDDHARRARDGGRDAAVSRTGALTEVSRRPIFLFSKIES